MLNTREEQTFFLGSFLIEQKCQKTNILVVKKFKSCGVVAIIKEYYTITLFGKEACNK